MQRNYTRTKGANPNPNMRRNVIILAIAIAAGTTVALLIGFWPSITASQQQKQYMTTTEANAFLTTNWPYANSIPGNGMLNTYTSRMPINTFVTDTNVLCEMAYSTLAQTMLDSASWKNIGLAPGICIIFKQADLTIAGNGPSTRVTTTGGYAVIAFKAGVFSGSYGAPNIAIIPLPVVNQAALISDGYTIITI